MKPVMHVTVFVRVCPNVDLANENVPRVINHYNDRVHSEKPHCQHDG